MMKSRAATFIDSDFFILLMRDMVVNLDFRQHHGHRSYGKFDTNEFVQNYLCCDMSMISFDLRDYGAC